MGYQTLYKDSKDNSRTAKWRIYLYPNKPEHNSQVDPMAKGARNGASQLLTQDAIGSYEIKVSYEHPNLDSYLGKKELLKKFIEYDGPNNKNSTPGSHGLLTNVVNNWGAIAELYDTPSDGQPDDNNEYFGWKVSANWLAGWNGNNKGKYQNSAIHEPAHNFVNSQNPDVQQYQGDDGNDDSTSEDTSERDHSLGNEIFGKKSPMLTGYTDPKNWGPCSSSSSVSGYTFTLTGCTLNAVEVSAKDSET